MNHLSQFNGLFVTDLHLLALISNGVDNAPDLTAKTQQNERLVRRRLQILQAAGHWVCGSVVQQRHAALVQRRKHPHQRGFQYVLSPAGAELLDCHRYFLNSITTHQDVPFTNTRGE
jgi:hypothetical protein